MRATRYNLTLADMLSRVGVPDYVIVMNDVLNRGAYAKSWVHVINFINNNNNVY